MKKPAVKTLLVLAALLICVIACAPSALAANDSQDGLRVTLITDKTSYSAGETIYIEATVKNNNDFTVYDIDLEVYLPSGLDLSSGRRTLTITSLGAGKSQTLTLTAVWPLQTTPTPTPSPTAALTTPKPVTPPQTGDGQYDWIWPLIALVAAGLVVTIAAIRKKKFTVKFLSLILCAVLALAAVGPVLAASYETRSLTVTETIRVNGVSRTISARLGYQWEAADTVPTAPTNLKADPGDAQVKLTWAAPSSNGGKAILRYEVSKDNGSTWTRLLASDRTYTFTGLNNGTEYTFAVRAVNAVGNGAAAVVKATPQAAATYTIAHDVPGNAHAFQDAPVGYSAQTPLTVTITNTGNTALTGGSIALTAGTAFDLSKTTLGAIASGSTGTFTVTPKAGLAAGIYTDTVTVTGTPGSQTASFTVSFTVNAAPATTFAVTMTDDGNGTAVADPSSAAAGATITLTATPTNPTNFEFMEWEVVSGGVTLSSTTTSTATFTMPAENVTIKAHFKPTAAGIAAEVAKITGFTPGTNTSSTLVFTANGSGGLTAGTTIQFVSTNIALGGSMTANGTLSLNTQNVVDAADLSSVAVTFTVTLNGVTSDERTLDASSLLGSGTTAGKLRTDKALFKTDGGSISDIAMNGREINTFYALNTPKQLSNGVAMPVVSGATTVLDVPASSVSIKADEGGLVMIAFAQMPTPNGDIEFKNVTLTCAGTSYTVVNNSTSFRINRIN